MDDDDSGFQELDEPLEGFGPALPGHPALDCERLRRRGGDDERRQKCRTPPGRTSILQNGSVESLGPNQRARCSGSVQASKTSSRGAAKTRVRTSSCSAVSMLALLACMLSLLLQLLQVLLDPIEALLPEAAVVLHPPRHLLLRIPTQISLPPLRPHH